MPSKHFDLALDTDLGGEQSSDNYVASQKAIKTYVDETIEETKTIITFRSWEE